MFYCNPTVFVVFFCCASWCIVSRFSRLFLFCNTYAAWRSKRQTWTWRFFFLLRIRFASCRIRIQIQHSFAIGLLYHWCILIHRRLYFCGVRSVNDSVNSRMENCFFVVVIVPDNRSGTTDCCYYRRLSSFVFIGNGSCGCTSKRLRLTEPAVQS